MVTEELLGMIRHFEVAPVASQKLCHELSAGFASFVMHLASSAPTQMLITYS